MKMTHDPFHQLDLNDLDVIVGGRSLTLPSGPLGAPLANAQVGRDPAAAEAATHGLTFLGGITTVGAGITIGPVGMGGSLAMGGPNHDLYGSVHGGVQVGDDTSDVSSGVSFTAGYQAGAVFGYSGASYDDVVTGHSTVYELGIASIATNDHGFIVQAGPTGFGVSESNTMNLTTDHSFDSVINVGDGKDHSAEINSPPPLTDWSGAFGEHELHTGYDADAAGANSTGDHSPDPNASDGHSAQDASPDHGGEEIGDHGGGGLAHEDQGNDSASDFGGNGAGHDFGGSGFGGNDASHDSGGGYFGNDFGDSNFGGGDFGGSDFA